MSSAQDQITELLDVPKDFLKEGTLFLNSMLIVALAVRGDANSPQDAQSVSSPFTPKHVALEPPLSPVALRRTGYHPMQGASGN
jgi:hypothetical protein